jgi:hypothetical protein
VTNVYVCLDDDAFGWSVADRVRQALPHGTGQVRVRTTHRAKLGPFMRVGGPTDGGSRGAVEEFRLLERTCVPDTLLQGDIDILARAIHEDYVRLQLEEGKTPELNPSMVGWDELPNYLRQSNRAQARHTRMKLDAVGCEARRLTDWDWDGTSVRFSEDEIETLARLEHDRFVAERKAGKWKPGPPGARKDVGRRINPTLVPWEELSDDEKRKDVNQAIRLPATLARAGFSIVRRPWG